MTNDPIVKAVRVSLAPKAAFDLFTHRMDEWWPMDRHSVSANNGQPARSLALDGRVGGALSEVAHDGATHIWGHVLEWDPGKTFVLTWHPGHGEDQKTTVRVTFAPDGEGTRVELTHSGWEALDDGASRRTGYDSGWVGVLDLFAKKAG